jgi:CRISPR/Cas system-associated exonuclease Cas4 (RecB family)
MNESQRGWYINLNQCQWEKRKKLKNSQAIHKAMNMALDEGCLFGITRPNGLEETDIGQDVSKVSEVYM